MSWSPTEGIWKPWRTSSPLIIYHGTDTNLGGPHVFIQNSPTARVSVCNFEGQPFPKRKHQNKNSASQPLPQRRGRRLGSWASGCLSYLKAWRATKNPCMSMMSTKAFFLLERKGWSIGPWNWRAFWGHRLFDMTSCFDLETHEGIWEPNIFHRLPTRTAFGPCEKNVAQHWLMNVSVTNFASLA